MARNKQATPDGAQLLFTELVVCHRIGDIFYHGGKSGEYTRTAALTADYVRQFIAKFAPLLAEYDAERGRTNVRALRAKG